MFKNIFKMCKIFERKKLCQFPTSGELQRLANYPYFETLRYIYKLSSTSPENFNFLSRFENEIIKGKNGFKSDVSICNTGTNIKFTNLTFYWVKDFVLGMYRSRGSQV